MKTLVLANQKGGVGKTAVATLLSHYLVRCGWRVLAVDLDHQGNFTSPLVLSRRCIVAPTTADRLLTEADVGLPQGSFVLVPTGDALLGLERQPQHHNEFAARFRSFLRGHSERFDVCVVDTNPNPDIRLIAPLVSADSVLSPIELNQEALDGVRSLLSHPRVGIQRIKAVLNPKLELIGLLPTMVEPTPFQRKNLTEIAQRHASLMVKIESGTGGWGCIPKRSAIAEAQAEGLVLWEMKKTAARDTWREIEPTFEQLAASVTGERRHAA